MHSIIIVVIYISCFCTVTFSNEDKDHEEFIPSNEWQIVKKGQKLPKGLHVRVNFETGITEAKLLDESEKENKESSALLEIPQDQVDSKLLESEAIKEALKKIKSDSTLIVDDIKKIKDQFRSYDQLKEEMSHMNLTAKIDAEVLQELFIQHKVEIEKEKIDVFAVSKILEDFDFLAHQIDNGIEFIRQNGFREIIYKNLNLTSSQIKEDTLKLLGSLLQNNPKVQIHAIESGAIGVLLRILTLDDSVQVKSRAIFALSCLVRRFPLAQLKLVENGGLSVITKLFRKDYLKIHVKIITLMNDLFIEHMHAQHSNQTLVADQYRKINLKKSLLEDHNWCSILNQLLISLFTSDPDEHDSIEKCLISMLTIVNDCTTSFDPDVLITLQARYKTLMQNEQLQLEDYDNNGYFKDIYIMCSNILLHVKNVKTEL